MVTIMVITFLYVRFAVTKTLTPVLTSSIPTNLDREHFMVNGLTERKPTSMSTAFPHPKQDHKDHKDNGIEEEQELKNHSNIEFLTTTDRILNHDILPDDHLVVKPSISSRTAMSFIVDGKNKHGNDRIGIIADTGLQKRYDVFFINKLCTLCIIWKNIMIQVDILFNIIKQAIES